MQKDSIVLKPNQRRVNGKVFSISFREGDHHILYIPSLQISSYGNTLKEAEEMMNEIVTEFFKTLLNRKDNFSLFYTTMRELGWSRNPFFKKKMSVDLSDTTYEDIKKEFNLPDDVELSTAEMAV